MDGGHRRYSHSNTGSRCNGAGSRFRHQGAMAGSHEVIHILHFVGAADSYIAREFQKHFLKLGLEGGLLGGGAAIFVFILAGLASTQVSPAGGDQLQALFGSFDLGLIGYVGFF